MARTVIAPVSLKQNNYAVGAGDLTIAFASDVANGNEFAATGSEVLIVSNSDASPHTFTVASVADHLGRTDATLTTYSVAATTHAAIQLSVLEGWKQADGNIYLNASDATLKFAVVRKN